MSGMGSGLSDRNSTIVSAFHSQLGEGGLIVLAIVAVVLLAANGLRAYGLRLAMRDGPRLAPAAVEAAEPVARRFLRISFGLLWVIDGLLQLQEAMPVGMVPQVIKPASAGAPAWVQDVVNFGAAIWAHHPVPAAASAVWIQLGIGLWLLAAARGLASRLGGAVSVAWGLVVWVFGEAFGGVFSPGQSWLFGIPGGVLLYCVAGLLLAAPERIFAGPRLGRYLLDAVGAFLLGMAVVQVWPSSGFWHKEVASMVTSMETTPQPTAIRDALTAFGSFDTAHPFAVNLFVVVALVAIAVALLSGRPAVARLGVAAAIVLFLAVWLLVQDLGVLGGVGTDPNSMVPTLLIIVAGYLALVRPGAEAPPLPGEAVTEESGRGFLARARRDLVTRPGLALRTLAACGAAGVVVLGTLPMAFASLNPKADPILSEAVDGTPDSTNFAARGFDLVDQYGRQVTLSSLRDKVVALTFLDPVCTSDCPVIAQEFRVADEALGRAAKRVEFIAVVANPLYRSIAVVQAFDRAEGLTKLRNWLYLTGSVSRLQKTWSNYGIQVEVESAGAMVAHSELAYVISRGRTRYVLDADPGPATQATQSSFSNVLETSIEHVLEDRG